jgi:hypothetical protein
VPESIVSLDRARVRSAYRTFGFKLPSTQAHMLGDRLPEHKEGRVSASRATSGRSVHAVQDYAAKQRSSSPPS